MAKHIIEPLPFKFDYNLYPLQENVSYIMKYNATDGKGNYLYWDKFRYRVDKGDDVKIAWWATKFNRLRNRKSLLLEDKEKNSFHFSIPDALQPKLYKIMKNIHQGIAQNDSIKQQFLISSLLMEEAISSSQLEGAVTTRRIAKDMLVSNRKPRNEDEQMIINNYLLMKEAKRTKDEALSIDLILDFHKIATQGTNHNRVVAGEFRTDNEIIITDGMEGNILFQPPCFTQIEERLSLLCEFTNTNHNGENNHIFIDPIIKAIILHFMIAYEHPFNDGNGRTARAIFYWYMLKNGFDYFEYVSISKLLKNAPKQYALSYLYSENDDNDLTYFIAYQLDIILRAIEELKKYLQDKSKEFEYGLEIFKQSKYNDLLNFAQKDIIKKAIKEAGRVFRAKEVAQDYDISDNSARKYLKELSQYKLLYEIKDGKSKIYLATNEIRNLLTH